MPIAAVAFDSYGTLFDVQAAFARHAGRLGEGWRGFAQECRQKQLEYTWVRGLARHYRDFAGITDDALAFVAARHGISDPSLLAALRDCYDFPDAFDDAAPALGAVRDLGLRRAVLSNGSPGMLTHALHTAKLAPLLDAVWSVEPAASFKPDPVVYRIATDGFGQPAEQVAFVTANAWDAFGAHAAGLATFWINRAQTPDEYGLRRVATELSGLADLPDALRHAGVAA